MKCEICAHDVVGKVSLCKGKCRTLFRLRGQATRRLLDVDEKTFGFGYDSEVKRAWIKDQLDKISSGEKDSGLFRMYLDRLPSQ